MKPNTRKQSKWAVASVIALVLAASVAAWFANRSPGPSSSQQDFAVGQVARENVFAPKKLTVIDPVATAERRQSELEKAPVVFRFNPSAADEAVGKFSADFAASRKKFLDAVEKDFKKRKLSTNQVAGPRFREVYTKFKNKNKTFPATVGQALKWAHGNSQEELQKQFRERLRIAAQKHIRSDTLPPMARSGPVRLINENSSGTSAELLARSENLRRSNLIGLSKAQKELMMSFIEPDRIVSDVLTNYLEVNCVFGEALTQQIHAEKTNSIWAFISYEPGQVIVQRGQIIDAKVKAALDELGGLPFAVEKVSQKQRWLWIAAILCVALALLIGLRSVLGRRNTALLPIGNVVALPMNESRNESLQANLMPHLARGLMNRLVRALISQRSDLIQTQTVATEQLNQLEQRLEQINTRLETRTAIYEHRIAELEKELAAAEEENRELIRVKILEARRNLEWAKAQGN